MYQILGVITGAIIGVIFMILIIRTIRKATHQNGTWAKYDERQELARGKGYRYAFFTMLILNAAALCWYSGTNGTPWESLLPMNRILLGIMIAGLLVYISYAIWTNAYIGTNETYRSSVILIGVIALVNLGIGGLNLRVSGSEEAFINLSIGILMLVICLEMIAKNQYDRQTEENDEE